MATTYGFSTVASMTRFHSLDALNWDKIFHHWPNNNQNAGADG
jgi:hypothetical protein